jgi:polysaccharide export outer membrane protein
VAGALRRLLTAGALSVVSLAGVVAADVGPAGPKPSASPTPPPDPRAAADAARTAEPGMARALGYQIGPEDVLHISVWRNEAVTRTVPVRPDGMISLPLLNDVPAAGLTPLELRDRLARQLTEFMPQPEVAVIVMEVRSFKVSVMGQVMKPGRYTLGSWATVADVLALGGGLTGFAGRSRITVLRPEGRSVRKIPFNYDKLANGEQLNFFVRPGDTVLVP